MPRAPRPGACSNEWHIWVVLLLLFTLLLFTFAWYCDRVNFELRPTLFGGQVEGVLKLIREGCRLHGRGGADCRDCRVIEAWEEELSVPKGSISTPAGYVEFARPISA